MEKIYIEENQKKKMSARLTASVGLSFAVAFVAIVSILFISMSGTTYSLPNVDTLPATITTLSPADNPNIRLKPTDSTGAGDFAVEPYVATVGSGTKPVYCVESAIMYSAATLKRGQKISDEGFIYLLTKIETLNIDSSKLTTTGSLTADQAKSYVKSWLGQTAIWMYLGSTGAANSKTVAGDSTQVYVSTRKSEMYNIKNMQVTDFGLDPKGTITAATSFYKDSGMNTILDKAILSHNSGNVLNVSVSGNGNKFTYANDRLKSDKITVKIGTSGLISDFSDNYTIKLGNAPKGTQVYGINASGKEELIKDLDNVSYSKYQQLYLYVPAKEVKGKVDFTLSVQANFEVYTGYYYEPTSGTAQRVTTVDKFSHAKVAGMPFNITKAPDTGTDASSIMYIIGMVVLLSGLGILYVNIKNQKQYQQ
ncbi:MAG: LPXTG cell wall anchor domain-containing protein [Bacilli bacterium]|nr:LPXTG cell wall anchor domain-containing protein [Bacilli bacterium]